MTKGSEVKPSRLIDAELLEKNKEVFRDVYAAVAARRTAFDTLLWQVPVISLTAQAFLFTIILSPDTRITGRVIASLLAVAVSAISVHLFVRQRQAEMTDAEWLERYENQVRNYSGPGLAQGLSQRL